MTRDKEEILEDARRAAADHREAVARSTRVGLVAAKVVTRSVFPAASGLLALESDQGPFLWLDAVIDPSAETGRHYVSDLDGEFQDWMMQIGETLDDTDFRHLWLPVAHETAEGWILEFDKIADHLDGIEGQSDSGV